MILIIIKPLNVTILNIKNPIMTFNMGKTSLKVSIRWMMIIGIMMKTIKLILFRLISLRIFLINFKNLVIMTTVLIILAHMMFKKRISDKSILRNKIMTDFQIIMTSMIIVMREMMLMAMIAKCFDNHDYLF